MIQYQNNKQDNRIILESSKLNIVDNRYCKSLNDYFKSLQNHIGCTYVFYIFENTIHDQKIIYSSNWEWQNLLIGEKLINDCPVFKAAAEGLSGKKNLILLPWNHITCKTSKEKEITILRTEYNIANGIGISLKNSCYREGIGFGADANDFKFYQRLIADNLIYNILKKIRFLVLKQYPYKQDSQIVLH